MILKYIVPKAERRLYDNKKVLYCDILQSVKIQNDEFCFMVRLLNFKGLTTIFTSKQLKKLNIFEKILRRIKWKS